MQYCSQQGETVLQNACDLTTLLHTASDMQSPCCVESRNVHGWFPQVVRRGEAHATRVAGSCSRASVLPLQTWAPGYTVFWPNTATLLFWTRASALRMAARMVSGRTAANPSRILRQSNQVPGRWGTNLAQDMDKKKNANNANKHVACRIDCCAGAICVRG